MPTLDVDLDRTGAQYTGVTAADVTDSLVARESQTAPARWRRPTGSNHGNGISYPIGAADAAISDCDTLAALRNLPINAPGAPTTVLGGIADISRSQSDAVVSQYNIVPMVDIYATTQGRDLVGSRATSGKSSPKTTITGRRARSSPWSGRR